MAEQLAFDLPANVRLEAQDFFVSSANEQAFALIQSYNAWHDGKLALIGSAGSGKTHLAGIFAAQIGAQIIDAVSIDPTGNLPDTPLVVENGDQLAPESQEWLFHAHNHLRNRALPFLFTGRTAPARWPLTLPDLKSRLSAATIATIADPDDDLLFALLLKQFQDRQLMPAPDALVYLQSHLPRSFEAIRHVVALLDQEALAQSRPLTRPFVQSVLDSADLDG